MAYNDNVDWDYLEKNAQIEARNMVNALNNGLEAYNEWQSFREGRTNAQIATDLGAPATETWVAEMDAMFSAIKEMSDYANNVAGYQGDRFYSLRKFTI